MSELPLDETKAYLKGVLGCEVIAKQMGTCEKCGKYEDLRNGLCFSCATFPCGMPQRNNACNDVYRFRSLTGQVRCTRPQGVCQEEWDRVERQRLIASRPDLPPPKRWSKAKGNLRE